MTKPFDYESYMLTHEFKDAQIQALGEVLEETVEDYVKVIKKNNDILKTTKEMFDDLSYILYCGHTDSDEYLKSKIEIYENKIQSYLD